jgi:hypothetical protein
VPNADDRIWRGGEPSRSGFEAGVAFAIIADATAHARSLDRGSPATNPGHAVTNPRIRAGSTVVHSSCRLPWASIKQQRRESGWKDARLHVDNADIRARFIHKTV